MSEPVEIAERDGIASLRMVGERGHALNERMLAALAHAFEGLAEHRDVRAVVLSGAGKLFSPGLDLIELASFDRAEMTGFVARMRGLFYRMMEFPKPLIAGCNGHALAGGCVLALTADWRILRRGAAIGLNEIKIGVALPYGVTQILSAAVPAHRVGEVALLGRNYSDDDALSAGLAHEIATVEEFEEICAARAAEFASKEPLAFARTKGYLREGTLDRMRDEGRGHDDEFLDSWFAPATRARLDGIVAGLRKS